MRNRHVTVFCSIKLMMSDTDNSFLHKEIVHIHMTSDFLLFLRKKDEAEKNGGRKQAKLRRRLATQSLLTSAPC